MSVFFVNNANEEEVDSPAPVGDGNGNSSSGSSDGSNACEQVQYLELSTNTFWPKIMEEIRNIKTLDVRNQALPLARIKKIMKLDEDVKMISAEAPMLFSKAAEIFIMELTLRAWVHTEENKRRTLQRSDIAMAISKCDQFDFLIDIVPREETKISVARTTDTKPIINGVNEQPVQYYVQVTPSSGDGQSSIAQNVATTTTATASISNPTTIQVIQNPSSGQISTVTLAPQTQEQTSQSNNATTISAASASGSGAQIIQIPSSSQQNNAGNSSQGNSFQFYQQVVTPNGEVQHIPFVVVPVQQQQQQQQQTGRRKMGA